MESKSESSGLARVGEFSVVGADIEKCLDEMERSVTSGRKRTWLACLNPHSYAVSLKDAEYNAALHAATWLVPDGIGVVLASRLWGRGASGRIAGQDIFLGLSARLDRIGNASAFFLGSSESNLKELVQRYAKDFPNIKIAGYYSPPYKAVFSDEDLKIMVDRVNANPVTVLWVGMTAPKQEKWIYANLHRHTASVSAAIGAVFDFYTGKVERPHPLAQTLGLEWLVRLLGEPRRLWRRTFISGPIFAAAILRERMRDSGK